MMSSIKNDGAESREPTRTMAVLCRAACSLHRPAIQARIAASGFTILSERVEQWSVETDIDFLHDFLYTGEGSYAGDDTTKYRARWTARLTNAPIYVMALQRHRAAEMWQDMCGQDAEDGVAIDSGLRAEFGDDAAIYASPPSVAERQIAICFPTLATTETLASLQLNPRKDGPRIVTAVDRSGAFVVREGDDIAFDEHGQAFDAHSGEPLAVVQDAGAVESQPRSSTFKARPMPASTKPVTQPRLSRAAALRMGVALPEAPKRRSAAANSSSCQDDASVGTADTGNLGISGLPKANVSVPKSLAAPSIVPRMNRIAAGRTMGPYGSSSSDIATAEPRQRKPVDYSNTPGHKRSSIISGGGGAGSSGSGGGSAVASLAAPSVAPRLNKAAAARVAAANGSSVSGGGVGRSFARPSSVSSLSSRASLSGGVRKPVDFSNTPGHKRMSMTGEKSAVMASTLKSLQAPSIAPRANRASLARVGGEAVVKPSVAVSQAPLPRASGKENGPTNARERRPVDYSNTPGHKRASQSISTIASLAQPSIVPRSNATAQKRLSMPNAAAAARTTVRGAAPPSSFRV